MLKQKTLKEQKGIIVSDAILAVLIILLFAGIVTSLITNIILESTKIKMNSQQMDFATELLEYVEKLPYSNVTQENLIEYVNKKDVDYVKAGETIETVENEYPEASYKVGIKVEKYSEMEGNEGKFDIIKIITLTIENKLGEKEYSTTISKIKKANMKETKTIVEESQ